MGLAVVAEAAPALYILLTVVHGLLCEGYDPIRDTQSELRSVDSPYLWVMNAAGFSGLGLSILAFTGANALICVRSGVGRDVLMTAMWRSRLPGRTRARRSLPCRAPVRLPGRPVPWVPRRGGSGCRWWARRCPLP